MDTSKTSSIIDQKDLQERSCSRILYCLNHMTKKPFNEAFYKLHVFSIQKSQQYKSAKVIAFFKKVHKIFLLKQISYFKQINYGSQLIGFDNVLAEISRLKNRERVFDAKSKGLKYLITSWEEKKNNSQYREKYFTPKAKETSKMLKSKYSQKIYKILMNVLKVRYLQHFRKIQGSVYGSNRNLRASVLLKIFSSKRKYWLIYGWQVLKGNALTIRYSKHDEQIGQLDKKLVPVQDADIESIKEKQSKLQEALQNVEKDKNKIQGQIDQQVNDINGTLESSKERMDGLKAEKQRCMEEIEKDRYKNTGFQFGREEVFYCVYRNFLTNLKLCREVMKFQGSKAEARGLSKDVFLRWLRCADLRLGLQYLDSCALQNLNLESGSVDKPQIIQHKQIVESLLKQHIRLSSQEEPLELLPEGIWDWIEENPIASYEDLLQSKVIGYKMLSEMLSGTSRALNRMMMNIEGQFMGLEQSVSE